MLPALSAMDGTTIPTAFTTLLSSIWSNVTTTVSTITASPILLIPVGIFFLGGVIGIAKSLMGTKKRGR